MPPTWSSWPWVATTAVDAVGVLAQVGEVGQHEVDAVHVGTGEHQPAVDEQDAAVVADALLDRHAVAADLPEPAEEDDADRRQRTRVSHERDQVRVDLGGASARASRRVGAHRQPAVPGRLAEVAQHRLGRARVRRTRRRSRSAQLSSSRALTAPGAGDVAVLPAVEQLDDVRARPVRGHADQRRRRRPPAAAASARRRRCRPRSRPARRRSAGPSRPGCRRRP